MIEIKEEEWVLGLKPDYLLIFPWHFRENFQNRFKSYLENGGNLISPLPNIEVFR